MVIGAGRIRRDRGGFGSRFAIRSPCVPVLEQECVDKGACLLKGEIGTIPIGEGLGAQPISKSLKVLFIGFLWMSRQRSGTLCGFAVGIPLGGILEVERPSNDSCLLKGKELSVSG